MSLQALKRSNESSKRKGSYKIDLKGMKFGKLTVVGFYETKNKKSYWKCLCACGEFTIARSDMIKSGHTKSCGCLAQEISKKGNHRTHELSKTKLYNVYHSMKARCYNKRNKDYPYYGGRGIEICKEWLDNFVAFYKWANENGYEKGKSIDRINNDGNYEPENCQWVDQKIQNNNTRQNHSIEINGIAKTLSEWCEQLNVPKSTVKYRVYNMNMTYKEALLHEGRDANV